MKKIFLGLILLFLTTLWFLPAREVFAQEKIPIWFFWDEGCPHCAAETLFLERLQARCPQIEVKKLEIHQAENWRVYQQMGKEFHVPPQAASVGSVPLTIVGERYFLGFESEKTTGKEIEDYLNFLIGNQDNCPGPQVIKKINFLGSQISLSSQSSLTFLAVVLGLTDGINPCMFSVLLFLLTYLLAIGSRKKVLSVGLVFAGSVFVVYFLFMLGMLNLMTLIGVIQKIKMVVAIIALAVGVVMVKDFFFYGKWFSLELPKRSQPAIKKLIKKGTIPSAIALAFLSSLVELPCTSGIPLVYVTLLAQEKANSLPYLLAYNFFFVAPLILIILAVALAWEKVEKIEKWRQAVRKYMRLASGVILLSLGTALLEGWL